MSTLELLLLVVAGLAAGSINGAVGSGSLITLPILLTLGLHPTSAVTTNTIAMVLSAFGGVAANRVELREEKGQLRRLLAAATAGGIVGSILLLTTPPGAIKVVVPVLICFALLLVVFQPRVARWVTGRASEETKTNPYHSKALTASVVATSIYGGYFTAASGVLQLGVLGVFTGRPMGRLNGVKNLLGLAVNLTAGVAFTVAACTGHADVVWEAAAALALGATFGGYAGGRFARAVPGWALRLVIVVVAVASLVRALLG